MHFYLFDEGVPYQVHKFETLQNHATNYHVYIPPQRETPYAYRVNGQDEFIYGIIIPFDEADRRMRRSGSQPPKSIRLVLSVIELLFTKGDLIDYRGWLNKILEIHPGVYVVTDKGVRDGNAVRMSGMGPRKDAVLAPNDDQWIVKAFLRIVHYNAGRLQQPIQEALNNAIATGIFEDDCYYASIPKWYVDAQRHYGRSDSKDTPGPTD